MVAQPAFSLGRPVSGEHFFGRKRFLQQIESVLNQAGAVNLYSLRRMGKTSVLLQIVYLSGSGPEWQQTLSGGPVDSESVRKAGNFLFC